MDLIYRRGMEWALRLTMGLMFLYSGFDIMQHPKSWMSFVKILPSFIGQAIETTIGITLYLRIQGASEVLFAYIMFAWYLPQWLIRFTGFAIAAEMFFIMLLVGIDGVTFRDIGLFGAGAALVFMPPWNEESSAT